MEPWSQLGRTSNDPDGKALSCSKIPYVLARDEKYLIREFLVPWKRARLKISV